MPYKDIEKQREFQRNRQRRLTAEMNVEIHRMKSSGCKYCGEREYVCLDLHHKNPAEKSFTISKKLHHSADKVLEEIKKCEVVCSNCHRKLHAGLI